MKKILKCLIMIILFMIVGIVENNIYAATASISASKVNAYVGDTVTINVSVNAAAWNLNVSGNGVNGGPITGFNIEGTNQSTTKSYNLNTNSVGTYVISLNGDVSDGATDVTSDISQSVTVTVSAKSVTTTPPATVTPSKPGTNTNTNNSSANAGTSTVSSNAYLSQFRIDQPGMTPAFSKTIYNYAVTVGEDVDKLNVTAVTEHSKATLSVTGNTNLKNGNNIVVVKVTAQDKKTTKTYTINVTKADNPEKSNAYLQSLFVENMILTPEFSSEVFDYDLGKIDEKVDNLQISAFPVNENAKVEIIGNENLIVGENIVKVVVTSENGEIQNTYNLKVVKEEVEKSGLVNISNNDNNLEYSQLEDIWNTLKENAAILLLYLLVWIEFIQVVYLYEKLEKVQNVDVINKDNVQEEAHMDKNKGLIKRIKIWKNNKEE